MEQKAVVGLIENLPCVKSGDIIPVFMWLSRINDSFYGLWYIYIYVCQLCKTNYSPTKR